MLILLLSAALAVHNPRSHPITPDSVERMIHRYGAKATVDKLAAEDFDGTGAGDFDKVTDGVASGDARWLALVPKLDPGTDAGTAEDLRISVAYALAKNPAAVLRFTSRLEWFRDACGYPMIEPTRREARAYFKAAIPALKGVHDRGLEKAKQICVAELTEAQRFWVNPGRHQP